MIIVLAKSPVRPGDPEYDQFLVGLSDHPHYKKMHLVSAMRRGPGTTMDGPAARIYDVYVVLDIEIATSNTYPDIERFLKSLGIPLYEIIYFPGLSET